MCEVLIERLDHFGRGIGYINKKIVFVNNALPNELVKINIIAEHSKYYVGQVEKYLNKSTHRLKAKCPYYHICGGCNLQHLSYEDTILFKKNKIENIFARANLNLPNMEIIKNESPYFYRNKLSVQIVDSQVGFYEENSHKLVAITNCLLAKKSIQAFLKNVWKLNIQNGSLTIRSNYNDELLIVINTKDNVTFEPNLFTNCKIVGVILNGHIIYGTSYFYERIDGFLFKVSYDAFFQVNPYITKHLFSLLKQYITTTGNVLDLYSGVGTLGIIAAQKAHHVYSIEIIKNAILDNLENKKLNKCYNVDAFLGSAEKILNKISLEFETIIIDPPRKGLDQQALNIILNSQAKQIIYISCDPMTLVRDLKKLTLKYNLEKYYLLDMFSYTYHVESFCLLKLK